MANATITSLWKAGFALLFLFCFGATKAQLANWPPRDSYHNGRYWYYIKRGYVVADNHDTLRGQILFSSFFDGFKVRDTATGNVRAIVSSRVASVHFMANPANGIYTDWINLDHDLNFWILMVQKGPVAIYQLARGSGPSLLLIMPDDRINLIHKWGVLIHNDNDFDAGLLRFIRKRYNSNYADFNTMGNLYTYIVEKEYQRFAKGNADHLRDLETHLLDDSVPYGWLGHVSTVQRGYIVTGRHDTLGGLIRISPNLDDYAVLDTVKHAVKEVYFKDVNLMRVYTDSSNCTFRDWYNIQYKNAPWILLAKKDEVSMYEVTRLKPFWPSMVMVTPHKRVTIIDSWAMLLHGGYYGALRRFIYKRYKVVAPEPLGTLENISAYIVGKENERIAGD